MTLAEAILKLDEFPAESILFAERVNGCFTPESSVVVLTLDDEQLKMPTVEIAALKAPGTEYFLEAFLAREMVAAWRGQGSDSVSLMQTMIDYAEHDA